MMRRLRSSMVAVALLLPSLPSLACASLQITQTWIRQAPPGVAAMAGYARLRNAGTAAVTIRGLRSPDFGSVEIHESRMVGSSMQMRRADPLTLAPGQSLTLAPGGFHLMLLNPKAGLGSSSPIEFDCKDGPLALAFPVREALAE